MEGYDQWVANVKYMEKSELKWVANMITGEYYSITYNTNPKVTNWIHKVPFDHDYICIWKDQRQNRWCLGNCGFDDEKSLENGQ